MPRTGFYLHPAASLHDTGWRHPEHQGRLRAVASQVEKALPELHERVEQREVGAAGEEDLLRVHTPEHVERVRSAVERAGSDDSIVALDADTKVSAASWDAALGSTAAALTACRDISDGAVRTAFVATRPPGHHATADRAMGFCLFNHVAVAARWLRSRGRAERILIVDWDVHHGNGTQDIFYEDPAVFYCSLHQSPHYPGTGAASETGGGEGEGTVLNVPLRPGTPRETYRKRFTEALGVVKERFRPDFVLVSAGFDVLADDPLGGQRLEPDDLRAMTTELLAWADAPAEGRVAVLLEGGYVPDRLGDGVVAVLRGLGEGPPTGGDGSKGGDAPEEAGDPAAPGGDDLSPDAGVGDRR